MTVEEALKRAGYVFVRDYMQPEFDYPLDVWMREPDKAWVLGELHVLTHTCRLLLNPWDTWNEWHTGVEASVNVIASFIRTFNDLAAQQEEMDR